MRDRKAFCATCGHMTHQHPTFLDPDDSNGGEVWTCGTCLESLEAVTETNDPVLPERDVNPDYYLMSEDALRTFLPEEHSKSIFWHYIPSGEGVNTYIALINFDDFEKFYNDLPEDYKKEHGEIQIWCQQIVESVIDIDDIDIMDFINQNIFDKILSNYGASMPRNVCAIIGSIAIKFGMNPIELFNYLHENDDTNLENNF